MGQRELAGRDTYVNNFIAFTVKLSETLESASNDFKVNHIVESVSSSSDPLLLTHLDNDQLIDEVLKKPYRIFLKLNGHMSQIFS